MSDVFPPVDGYLSLGDAPQVIHRMVIQPFLPESEAALPLPLNCVTILL